MTGDNTLKDIQLVIFEHIDSLLEDLDQTQTSKLLASPLYSEDVQLQAINVRRNNNKSNSVKSKFKSSFREQFSGRQSKSTGQPNSKYCRICHLAGSDRKVYSSHEIGNCSRLSVRDLESLRDAMVLNGMVVVTDEMGLDPECQLQPGWDFDHQANSAPDPDDSD